MIRNKFCKSRKKTNTHMAWEEIIEYTLEHPAHTDLRVLKSEVKHPLQAGFDRSIGDFQGQIADYRLTLKDGRCIHVREYSDIYTVHWDYVSPSINPIGHILVDAPHWMLFLGLLFAICIFAYSNRIKFSQT